MNELIPDSLLPTDNALEIPVLRLDMQPSFAEIPFVCYGEQKRTHKMYGNGTLHFYTDDYRFNAVYEHPEKILAHNPSAIVEPNFSLYHETPIAFGMQGVYKKRFIGRAMQEKGIKVFVDLNVDPKFYKLNLLGVPKGFSSFCTRGYEDRPQDLEFEYEIAKYVSGVSNPLFVVYGGGEKVRDWCRAKSVVYVTPIIAIKNKLKAFEKMKENIAFLNEGLFDSEMKAITISQKRKELMDKQVEDFSVANQVRMLLEK